jgi:hypothetical protein
MLRPFSRRPAHAPCTLMRKFIRHPADIPIEVLDASIEPDAARAHDDADHPEASGHTHNVSLGGLSFEAKDSLEPGRLVRVRISHLRPEFESLARVAWCVARNGAFEVGVSFLDADDAFRARMVEQVCHIESYRQAMLEQHGRRLSAEEAAMEWISRFAEGFPAIGSQRMH